MPFVAHFLTTDVFSAERESGSLQVTETGAAPANQESDSACQRLDFGTV